MQVATGGTSARAPHAVRRRRLHPTVLVVEKKARLAPGFVVFGVSADWGLAGYEDAENGTRRLNGPRDIAQRNVRAASVNAARSGLSDR